MSGAGQGSVDQFLGDATTARMVSSRPSSRAGPGAGPPAGSGINAAAALRAQ